MKKTWLPIATLAFLFLWACHLGPGENKDTFAVAGDSAWTLCDTVTVALLDAQGNLVDTLFHDSLESPDDLRELDASGYDGREGSIAIRGTYKGGALCFEQSRRFEAGGKDVVVDTLADPGAELQEVELDPAALTLGLSGGAKGNLTARLTPRYAMADIQWSMDPSGIATLEVDADASEPTVKVTPLKLGKVKVTAVSRKDPSKSASSQVQVVGSLAEEPFLNEDSLLLYVGGEPESLTVTLPPSLSGQTLAWSSADPDVAKVDSKGVVTGLEAGQTTVKALLQPSGKSLTAKVGVKLDAPVLTVASKTGAPVDVPIVFAAKAVQEYGHLVRFKWDLDGDSEWDDSLAGPWHGESVDLPALEMAYAREGAVTARFAVRDSEGNETVVLVGLDIGNQPPEVLDLRADTLISIKDSIKLAGRLRDVDGKVALAAFDYDGDGDDDDSLRFDDSTARFEFGHRYNEAGIFHSILTARDRNGKARKDTVKVTVELDPPVADAGADITVLAGSLVPIQAKGTDKFGAIAKREIKVAGGAYIGLSKQDTSILVSSLGAFDVVVRVTDDDGQSDEDTLRVNVIEGSKSNADLAALRLSKGALEPGFKPVTQIYSAVVDWADSALALEATPADPEARIAVNGKPLAAGKPSDPLKLAVGTQVDAFKVVVTAQDGTQKVYTVSITRNPNADARLAKLDVTGFALKPAFAAGTLEYLDTVASAVGQITVKPVPMDANATLTVNDTAYPSGSAPRAIALHPGGNPVRIVVTAQDGSTRRVYRIVVARKSKRILYTQLGGAAPVLLDSAEILPNTPDSIKAVAGVGWTFDRWTVVKGVADVSDSLKAATQAVIRGSDARLVARFEVTRYAITTVAAKGGSYSIDTALVEHGKDTTVTLTPLGTHRFGGLRDNDVPVSTLGGKGLGAAHTYTLKNVTADHKLEAAFVRAYTIKVDLAGNGKVDPSGALADSGSTHSFAFLPSTGHLLSSLTDNGKPALPAVTGDVTQEAVYKLENVSEDHVIVGGITIRQFTLTVVGIDLCVHQVQPPCPPGQLCILPCLIIRDPPDSVSYTVNYGTSWVLSTRDTNATGQSFLGWSGGPPTLTTNPDTVAVTSDLFYRASYLRIIPPRCPPVCLEPIDPPPILLKPSAREPEGAATREPEAAGPGGGSP